MEIIIKSDLVIFKGETETNIIRISNIFAVAKVERNYLKINSYPDTTVNMLKFKSKKNLNNVYTIISNLITQETK